MKVSLQWDDIKYDSGDKFVTNPLSLFLLSLSSHRFMKFHPIHSLSLTSLRSYILFIPFWFHFLIPLQSHTHIPASALGVNSATVHVPSLGDASLTIISFIHGNQTMPRRVPASDRAHKDSFQLEVNATQEGRRWRVSGQWGIERPSKAVQSESIFFVSRHQPPADGRRWAVVCAKSSCESF